MLLQLEGVAVPPFAAAGHGLAYTVKSFLQATAPPFEDLQARGSIRPPEEGEVDVEPLVLPGGRPWMAHQ